MGHGLLRIQINGSLGAQVPPSGPNYIVRLRKLLGISQTALGELIGVSPMAVSRWERLHHHPSGNILIKLGTLAQDDPDLCWAFWNLAGLHIPDVVRVLPIAEKCMI
jgi:transcriptional regulator with XRE-family HTH domain